MRSNKVILFFIFFSIHEAFSQDISPVSIRPVVQIPHKNSVTQVQANQAGNLVLTSDGLSAILWELKNGDVLNTFNANFATFNKQGDILTFTTTGDERTQVTLYNSNTLQVKAQANIDATAGSLFWNTDSSAVLVNSGRSNFYNAGHVIMDPFTLQTKSSFRGYSIMAFGDVILVTNYIREQSRYTCSAMNYKGEIAWTVDLPEKHISCCSATQFGANENYFYFFEDAENPYVLEISSGKTVSAKSAGISYVSNSRYESVTVSENYSLALKYVYYGGSTTRLVRVNGDEDVPLNMPYTSAFDYNPRHHKVYFALENGIGVYDVLADSVVNNFEIPSGSVSVIDEAVMDSSGVYLLMGRSYYLNLKTLSFEEKEIVYNKDKICLFSVPGSNHIIFQTANNNFHISDGKTVQAYDAYLMCVNNEANLGLVNREGRLALLNLVSMQETPTGIVINKYAINAAEFSPDGKYVAISTDDHIYLFNTQDLTVKEKELDLEIDKTAVFKSTYRGRVRYNLFEESEIAWSAGSRVFTVHLGELFTSNFDLNMGEIGRGYVTSDEKYLLCYEKKKFCVKDIERDEIIASASMWDFFYYEPEFFQDKLFVTLGTQRLIVSLPDLATILSVTAEEAFQADLSLIHPGDKSYIVELNENKLTYYAPDKLETVATFEMPNGTWQILTTTGDEYTIIYDWIYRGTFLKVNNRTLEPTWFAGGEMPFFSHPNLVGKKQGSEGLGSFFPLKYMNCEDLYDVRLNNGTHDLLVTATGGGDLKLYKLSTNELLATVYIQGENFMVLTPDNYYAKSAGNREVKFAQNQKLYSFDQFDLKYNRPDIVLERIGLADSAMISVYHKAYQKRLQKMGYTEDMLKEDFHLPELEIENYNSLAPVDEDGKLTLDLRITDTRYKLDRINVWINDVAVHGSKGIDIRDKNPADCRVTIPLDLARGENKVQVSVLNQAGAESYKETIEVRCTAGKEKPDLYLIAIGESRFEQSEYNLTYAAKDAEDFSRLLSQSTFCNKVHVKTLVNQQVVKEALAELRSFLSAADINDHVIVFLAGHGVLDANLDYYYATYDMDFKHPERRGIPYEELENLLDGIKPLKKLLLIDACHSGEVDKEEVVFAEQATAESGDIQFRAVGSGVETKGGQSTFELSKLLFGDLRRGTGATVISSAGGMEFAIESDSWKNGLFTYCLIEGLMSKAADKNEDGEIWISEAREYVSNKVFLLSGGIQRPTSRVQNTSADFRIW